MRPSSAALRLGTSAPLNAALLPISALLICVFLAACGGGSSSPSAPTQQATLTSITVSGSLSMASAGQTTQLTATANFSNGTSQVVTAQVTWDSSDQAVATVSASGLCTAVTFGQAEVRARYQGLVGTALVQVRANLAGSWRGSWQSYWLTGALAATFTQTGEALTGTVTVSDSFCFTQPVQVTGSVTGGTVNLTGYAPGGVARLTVSGTADASGNVLAGTTAVTAGGNCAATDGTFTLQRQ